MAALVALIQPHAHGARHALGGRPPFAIEMMLRIQYLQLLSPTAVLEPPMSGVMEPAIGG